MHMEAVSRIGTLTKITDPMMQRVRATVAQYAHDDREARDFMDMLTPDLWRCAICKRVFVVQSLARSCEKGHSDGRGTGAGSPR